VPATGLALAIVQGRLTEAWILVALGLTMVAGALLALRIVPAQRAALDHGATRAAIASLGMLGGIVNLLWVIVVVLMVVRPGAS
jgi:hypothetical protein